MHEHFEKRKRERGDSFSDLRIEEFSMAKIKRPYVINGVSFWLTGDSEQEIADKYAEIKNSSRPGEPVRKSKHNFEKFAENNWQYISQTVSRNTNLDYKRYMRNQILPHFGKMNVEDITRRDVQDFYDKYPDKAFSTVHKWRIVLSRILQIAVGDRIIPIDPTKDKRLTHSKKQTQRAVPCTEQYREFLKDIERLKHPHERLYMAITGYTGLRRGEVLALR
jgi:integrase